MARGLLRGGKLAHGLASSLGRSVLLQARVQLCCAAVLTLLNKLACRARSEAPHPSGSRDDCDPPCGLMLADDIGDASPGRPWALLAAWARACLKDVVESFSLGTGTGNSEHLRLQTVLR